MSDHTEQELDAFAEWERDSWEARAAAYAAEVGRLTRGAIPALLDAVGAGAGTRLLDIATGPGFVAEAAVERGAVVTAVDQSAAMVRIAAGRLPGVDVRQASAESSGLADTSYDAVVANFLLNHLARPSVGVAELVRVLAAGGRLAMTVWDLPAANRATGLLGEVVTELGIRGAVPSGPDSGTFANRDAFRALLTQAGLVDVTVEPLSWILEVEPGRWFDTVGAAMPRSGAVLAHAGDHLRSQARTTYVERALALHGTDAGLVALPVAAVLGCGRRQDIGRGGRNTGT